MGLCQLGWDVRWPVGRFPQPLPGALRELPEDCAFLETLAHFRADPAVVAEYETIEALDGDEQTTPPGLVPTAWCRGRLITKGVATEVRGSFVLIGAAATIAELRQHFAARAVSYGLPDLDAATIRMTAPRAFTQEISTFIEGQRDDTGEPYAGIHYLSKHGDDLENWAIFEMESMAGQSPVLSVERETVDPEDGDLVQALRMLGLRLQA
jgi:hypothetical protein